MQLTTTDSELTDFELCFQDNRAFKVVLGVGIWVPAAVCCMEAGGIRQVRNDAGDSTSHLSNLWPLVSRCRRYM